MGVASQVTEHTLGSSERGFGINDPILPEKGSEEGSERLGVAQRLGTSREAELPLAKARLQAGHAFASEDPAEHLDREQEGVARMNPALVIRCKTAGRNDAVNVGMVQEILTPGVQDTQEADLSSQMAWVCSDLQQGFRFGAEQ